MKLEYFLLPLAADASSIWRRQLFGGGKGLGGSKVAGVKTLKPELTPNAKHTITKIGPFNLKGVRWVNPAKVAPLTHDRPEAPRILGS